MERKLRFEITELWQNSPFHILSEDFQLGYDARTSCWLSGQQAFPILSLIRLPGRSLLIREHVCGCVSTNIYWIYRKLLYVNMTKGKRFTIGGFYNKRFWRIFAGMYSMRDFPLFNRRIIGFSSCKLKGTVARDFEGPVIWPAWLGLGKVRTHTCF